MDSVDRPVDQTRANLNVIALILRNVTNYVQTQANSSVGDTVRCKFSVLFTVTWAIIIPQIARGSTKIINSLLQWTTTAIKVEASSR